MVRTLIVVFVCVVFRVFGQSEVYVRPGLLNAGLTITPSTMLNRNENNIYLSGHLEGRLDDRLSIRGETFYYIDGKNEIPYFNFNTRTFLGVLYHMNKGNFDSHVGFMPGMSVMQINGDYNHSNELPYRVVPSFAANVGVTYYVWKFFNFFANVTYVHSTANHVTVGNGRADELMVSAGLGLNVNTIKAK